MEAEKKDEKGGWRVPDWLRELGFKLLPWALMGLIGGSIGLFVDNVANKRDISRNAWRLDQQEARQNRFEARQDRLESAYDELHNEQHEFQDEALKRLDVLLDKERRRR